MGDWFNVALVLILLAIGTLGLWLALDGWERRRRDDEEGP